MRRLIFVIAVFPILMNSASADFSGSGGGFSIPDDDPVGASSGISVSLSPDEVVTDVSVELVGLTHTWVGDLTVTLTGPGGSIDLMFRTGDPEGDCCGDSSDLDGNYTFADGGDDWWWAAFEASGNQVIPNATYAPTTVLGVVTSFPATFGGTMTNGTWTLTIRDLAGEDVGSLVSWNLNITTETISVAPDSFTIITGSLVTGGLPELFDSDDQYLVMDPIFGPFRYRLIYQVDATSPNDLPSVLRFQYESKTLNFVGTVDQKIELFNYLTGLYETVDDRLTTSTDTVVTITPTGVPMRFVQAGTGAMRARITYQNSVSFWVFATSGLYLPFESRVDQIAWLITP